jgi:branched-chain amino acid aminotransferase
LQWCDVREVDEPVAVAEGADEVFLASTTRDVQPVTSWGDRDLPAPGAVTAAVMETWRVRAAADLDP